jgi:hypothetical protein
MLKEIAAYGAVVVGAAGLVLSAAPAQAQTVPASATQIITSYSGCDDDGGFCREQPRWRSMFNIDKKHDFNKKQKNRSFNGINLCDTHILGLDHLLSQNNEQGKCSQASFNNN